MLCPVSWIKKVLIIFRWSFEAFSDMRWPISYGSYHMNHMIHDLYEKPIPSFLQTSSSLGRNLFKNADGEDSRSMTLTATRVPFETVSSEPPNFDVDDVLSRLKI